MGNIQKRIDSQGKTHFRVQIRLKGFPPQSGTFERLTDAKRWAQQTEADMRGGRFSKTAESKRHTAGELIDRYLRDVMPTKRPSTQQNQVMHLNWWKQHLGYMLVADLTPRIIADAKDELAAGSTRSGEKRSPATVVRYLAAFSNCLTFAVKRLEWADDNPMRRVEKPREPKGRVRFLSDDERFRLLRACAESRSRYLYPIVLLALSTGMRRSEIMQLTWDRVDFDANVVNLGSDDTKNYEPRDVPLVSQAHSILEELHRNRTSNTSYVFPAPETPGTQSKPIDIESAWRRAVREAEIQDFRFHDLRHSAASYLAMNGATQVELAEILGHKTLQVVKRYAHLSREHRIDVVKRMNQKVFGNLDGANRAAHD